MEIKVYDTFNSELESYWLTVSKNNRFSVFESYNWLEYWYKIYGSGQKVILQITVLLSEDCPFLILPFCITKKYGLKKLTFLGYGNSDYKAYLIKKELFNKNIQDINSLWKNILSNIKHFDYFLSDKLPESQLFIFSNKLTKFRIIKQGPSYLLTLPSAFDDLFFKPKIKPLLMDSKRQLNKLLKLGSVEFKIIEVEDTEYEFYFNKLIAFKRFRYKYTGVKDIFENDINVEFYKNIRFRMNEETAKTHLSILKLNEELIAAHWGVVDEKSFYYILPSYNHKYENYSPGRLLMERLINNSIQNNLGFFDFTQGEEIYKKKWSDLSIELFEICKWNSILGFIFIHTLEFKRKYYDK
jgi:CelD/BcsL family acetyltransferase involved in cellulose biosynthesis